jgi:hypothetical protein
MLIKWFESSLSDTDKKRITTLYDIDIALAEAEVK